MEVKQINQLMVAMGRYGIKRISIKQEGVEVEIEREDKAPSITQIHDLLRDENPLKIDFEKHKSFGPVRHEHAPASKQETKESTAAVDRDDQASLYVTSPMVGTVYHAPSPNDPLFVKVGDRIEKNSVVCIIEAMKVMNEVKAGVSGIVQEILVDNGQPVEFGTKLFRIAPQ